MGCAPSKDPSPAADVVVDDYGALGRPLFAGVPNVTRRVVTLANAYVKRMESLSTPHVTTRGLLLSFHRTRTFRIYLHVTRWECAFTAACVETTRRNVQAALDAWLKTLRGALGFTSEAVKVKIFGFVFEKGVEVDATFLAAYGAYPRVEGWPAGRGERCPWKFSASMGGGGAEAPFPSQNFYQKTLDLSSIRVTQNDSAAGATFSPPDWEAYQHPKGVRGFDTRVWIGSAPPGTGPVGVAQRHYLKLVGFFDDCRTAKLTDDGRRVLLHELGHVLFLDDLYDSNKYPSTLAPGTPPLGPQEAVMHSASKLTALDKVLLRRTWVKQSQLFS